MHAPSPTTDEQGHDPEIFGVSTRPVSVGSSLAGSSFARVGASGAVAVVSQQEVDGMSPDQRILDVCTAVDSARECNSQIFSGPLAVWPAVAALPHCALGSSDAAASILGQPVTVTVSSVYR